MLFLCSERDFFADSGEHLRGAVHRPFHKLLTLGHSRASSYAALLIAIFLF